MKTPFEESRPRTNQFFVGIFDNEKDVLSATLEVRKQGWAIDDIYTPYFVHGLDTAMGLRPTRLPIICLIFGTIGLTLALSFQYWTTAIDWPINIGGKPWNSLPAFVPVTFELMVLFAGLGVVAALLLRTGLLPGRNYKPAIAEVEDCSRVTDDKFVMVLLQGDSKHDLTAARTILENHNVLRVEQGRHEGQGQSLKDGDTL